MQHQHRRIPTTIFDQAHTRLDSYLWLIYAGEQARRRQCWQVFVQRAPTTHAGDALVEQLQHQFPTPHLDAAEEQVN
jgi:hypothetical protein